MRKLLILTLLIIIAYISCHSTIYPQVDMNEVCYKPNPAKAHSWHFHILFWSSNENHKKGAYDLRDKFISEFTKILGPIPICKDLYHGDIVCLFDPHEQANGPFLTAEWSVFITNETFDVIVRWIMQNRGIYDLFVHPNSGCQVDDHTRWAMWGGNSWELDKDILKMNTPYPLEELKSKKLLLENLKTSEIVQQYISEHEQ